MEEVNWKKWRSNLGILKEEEPELELEPDIMLISPQQKRMDSLTHLCFQQFKSINSKNNLLTVFFFQGVYGT